MNIVINENYNNKSKFDKRVERGIFDALSDLIKLDNNIVWDPVGAFFNLTCGYSIHKYNIGGAVFDSDGDEIFLTDAHIDRLFELAKSKRKEHSRLFGHNRA